MSSLKSLAKGSFILLVSNIVLKAINFLLLPLYTSYLTPSDYGVVDLALTVISLFVSLFSLCLDTGFFTFFYDNKSEEYKKEVFNSTFFMILIISIIPIILLLFSKNISFLIYKEDYTNVVILMLISIFATLLTLIPVAQIKIENKMGIFGVINILIGFISILLNIFMVTYLQLGYISLIITNVTIAIVQLISYLTLIRKRISIKSFNKNLLRNILIYSIPLIPATISGWILDLSDRYFINTYYSTFEVGLYGVANKIVIMITVFLGAFQTAYPSFVFSNANSDDEDNKEKFRKILNIFMIIFLVIGISISIFSKEIITIMTDRKYFEAYKMVPFLIFGQIAYGIAFLVGAGMSIAKKSKYSMMVSWICAIVNIILNAIFIPKYGAVVAAITTLISFIILAILNYVFSQKFYKCNYQFKKCIFLLIISLAISIISIDIGFLMKVLVLSGGYILVLFSYGKEIKDIMLILKSKLKWR